MRRLLESESAPDEVVDELVSTTYAELTANQRFVVQLLALARAPLPEDAVARLLGDLLDPLDAQDAIDELVDAGEVKAAGGVLELHPLDADHVRDELVEHEPARQVALDDRLAAWWAGRRKPLDLWRTLDDATPSKREYRHLWRAGHHARGAHRHGRRRELPLAHRRRRARGGGRAGRRSRGGGRRPPRAPPGAPLPGDGRLLRRLARRLARRPARGAGARRAGRAGRAGRRGRHRPSASRCATRATIDAAIAQLAAVADADPNEAGDAPAAPVRAVRPRPGAALPARRRAGARRGRAARAHRRARRPAARARA